MIGFSWPQVFASTRSSAACFAALQSTQIPRRFRAEGFGTSLHAPNSGPRLRTSL